MASAKILVVEDDTAILKLIFRFLQQKNYEVQAVTTGKAALEIFATFKPDLVILDINLPDILGYDLCEQMQRRRDVYVLMLSSRANPEDKATGFGKGTDDYLTKPFDIQELEWRVKALLKRQPQSIQSDDDDLDLLIFQDLIIDPNRREIKLDGQFVNVTALEFEIIYFLASHRDKVWSRADLIEKVWKFTFAGDSRVVDVHIGQIRKKFQALSSTISVIKTVRGVGYKFDYSKE